MDVLPANSRDAPEAKVHLLRTHPKPHSGPLTWAILFIELRMVNKGVIACTWSAWLIYALRKLWASLLIDRQRRQTVKVAVDVSCVFVGDIKRDQQVEFQQQQQQQR